MYNAEVGYCQSMNFMVGFLLMVSGGREKESFWVFNAIVSNHLVEPPYMDGLTGFYENGFPILSRDNDKQGESRK